MPDRDLVDQILGAWRINRRITLQLLQAIPAKGLSAVPAGSKGRNVAQVFAHMHKARFAWLRYFSHESVAGLPRFAKGATPTKSELRAALISSGRAVEAMLKSALRGDARIKSFEQQPVRWMAYLIAHDSHHRGQIALALKQSGRRLPERVAIQQLWQQWYWGKQ